MALPDRRYERRVPLEMYLNAYVDDRPHRGFTVNLSESGLYLNTLSRSPLPPQTPVGLELALPGASETIWAAGRLCYDEVDDYFYGEGIRFVAMARRHLRLLHDFLTALRRSSRLARAAG
jgi:PilZ domain-containing protein